MTTKTDDNVVYPGVWNTPGPITGAAAPAWDPGPGTRDPVDERDPVDAGPRTPVEAGPVEPGPVAEAGPGVWWQGPKALADRVLGSRRWSPGVLFEQGLADRLPRVDLQWVVRYGTPVVVALARFDKWTAAGAGIVLPVTVWRWVWQPDRSSRLSDSRKTLAIQARAVRDAARAGEAPTMVLDHNLSGWVVDETKSLRVARCARAGVLAAAGGVAWWQVPGLLEVTPWWAEALGAAAVLASLAAAGWWWLSHRSTPAVSDVEAGEVPDGLALTDSDRGALLTLQESLNAVGARARVETVRRGSTGWGFTFGVRTAKGLTAAQVDELAHLLDVRRGGLVLGPDPQSTQLYRARTILEDLLAEPFAPDAVPAGYSLTQRAPLVRRFNGSTMRVPMLKSVLLLGETGSGKSGALREYLRWIVSARAHVVGLDLAGGADLAAFAGSMHAHCFGLDVPKAERLARFLSALVRDRTERLSESGRDEWSADLGRPWFVVVDEYWDTARHKALREPIEHVAVSGRKVHVYVVAANNKRQTDLMKSTVLTSQIDHVWLFGMSPDDERALPAEWRNGGARPSTLRPALTDDPRDAGKAYGIGMSAGPELVRFANNSKADSRAVAAQHPAPELDEHDAAVWDKFTLSTQGTPPLFELLREAIVEHSGNRVVPRASVAEIAEYWTRNGHATDSRQVTNRLTEAFGPEHRPPVANMNFAPGDNPKGYRLDEVNRSIEDWKQARAGAL